VEIWLFLPQEERITVPAVDLLWLTNSVQFRLGTLLGKTLNLGTAAAGFLQVGHPSCQQRTVPKHLKKIHIKH